MGKGILKIGDRGSTYISDELRDDGFKGEVPYYSNARIVILVHPKATLEAALQSLEITKQDFEIRRKGEKQEREEKDNAKGDRG